MIALESIEKLWERRLHNLNKPKKKRVKPGKTSSEAPSTTPPPKASSSAPTSKKRGPINEDDDVSLFLSFEGPSGEFEKAFVPNCGVRTQDLVFGYFNISSDWFVKSPTPFDRA